MMSLRCLFQALSWCVLSSLVGGCGAVESSEPEGIDESVLPISSSRPLPKDLLIAQLVKDSARVNYPLTRLFVEGDGRISGLELPEAIASDLAIINSMETARISVVRAVTQITGLPDYVMASAPLDVPTRGDAQSSAGDGRVRAGLSLSSGNIGSWRATLAAFGAECPLLSSVLSTAIVADAGDGASTPTASSAVTGAAVMANPYGMCPASARPGTYCKLGYSTSTALLSRKCQLYYGYLRCLVD